MTVGANIGADPEGIPESDLVLLWGTNTLTSNPHLWPFVLEASERGAPIIAIDPIRTRTAAQCDEWIAHPPGNRRGARAGHDARVARARTAGRRLHRALHARHRRAARARARVHAGTRVEQSPASRAEAIVSLGERYGRAKAAFIRVNYGLQRHGGGGMAVRTIACLPALTGHWRRAGGGVQLSSSAQLPVQHARWSSAPTCRRPVRTINMIRLGEALTSQGRGRRRAAGARAGRLQLEPRRGGARPQRGARAACARDDLFTVVLEHFQTDTADYADIVLPATTQLEHWDLHLVVRPPLRHAEPAVDRAARRGACRTARSSAASPPAWGSTIPSLRDDDLTLIRQALDSTSEKMAGRDARSADRTRMDAAQRAHTVSAVRRRADSPRRPGSASSTRRVWRRWGSTRCRRSRRRTSSRKRCPSSPARYPLTLISSPAHQFLNSTFVNIGSLRRGAREPECLLHPIDAERARHRRRRARRRAQRPRRVHRGGPRRGLDPSRRGLGAVDLVGQVRRGRRQREPDHVAARDRPRARTRLLRQPRGSGAGRLKASARALARPSSSRP